MNDSIATIPASAVVVSDRQPVTSSRMVAEVFGKRHDNVLRDVQNLVGGAPKSGEISPDENVQNLVGDLHNFVGISPDKNEQPDVGDPHEIVQISTSENEQTDVGYLLKFEEVNAHNFVAVSQPKFGSADPSTSSSVTEFSAHNFVLAKYTDPMNREQSEYLMTKDGFMLLVMGYTGEKAMQIKIAYINAFNAMAEALTSPVLADPARLLVAGRAATLEEEYFDAIRRGLLGETWGLFPFGYRAPQYQSFGKTVLGRYDESFYYLDTWNAYGLYSRASVAPAPLRVVYGCLIYSGLMIPYEDPRHNGKQLMTRNVDMHTRKVAAIRISRDAVDLPVIPDRKGGDLA